MGGCHGISRIALRCEKPAVEDGGFSGSCLRGVGGQARRPMRGVHRETLSPPPAPCNPGLSERQVKTVQENPSCGASQYSQFWNSQIMETETLAVQRTVPATPTAGAVKTGTRIVRRGFAAAFREYCESPCIDPLLLLGDAKNVLKAIPDASIACVMTSPPYWGKREYDSGGIGQETTLDEYVRNLIAVFRQVRRVLKPTGSFWLNIGDTYTNQQLAGIPWRVALRLTDREGWIMKNSVIWNKMKSGMDNSGNRLGNIHENIFHLVKQTKGYYYDVDAIRSKPQSARTENGTVISSTGVTGIKYRAQIEESTELSEYEKTTATTSLDNTIAQMAQGQISDFRMIIRGNQRTTHSDSDRVSGRAKELKDKGFYIIRCHSRGSKPTDVWNIVPEDTQNRKLHFAPFPTELCRIPILATCPEEGLVLDPFCGTGTTLLAAQGFNRKSVGIDRSENYLDLAQARTYEHCS